MKPWSHLMAAVAGAGLLAACGGGSDSAPTASTEQSLAATASSEPSTTEFMKLAQMAGTTSRLAADEQLTLIAPSNAAMAEMRAEIDELKQPENKAALQSFVESHIVAKRMLASDMQTGTETSVSGGVIDVEVRTDSGATEVTVNGSGIAKADIKARNGVLFVTHKPLWRPSALQYVKHLPEFSILYKAIRAAGLEGALRTREPEHATPRLGRSFCAIGRRGGGAGHGSSVTHCTAGANRGAGMAVGLKPGLERHRSGTQQQ